MKNDEENKLKVDFSKPLTDLEGQEISIDKANGTSRVRVPLTLAEYARQSLNYKDPKEELTVEANGKRYDILKKVMNKTQPQTLTATEIVVIRQCALKCNWSTEIEGAANEILPA